ncbi:hypothetical protein Dimus_034152 [Dionaea muscipula]
MGSGAVLWLHVRLITVTAVAVAVAATAAGTSTTGKTINSASSVGSACRVRLWRWDSPIPYLFGGLGLVMGIIAIAVVMIACSQRKRSPPSSSSIPAPNPALQQPPPPPCVVVIMAGDHEPKYLASCTHIAS